MFGRRRRQNRRGIGGGLVPFLPTQLSGCVLWLRADLGVTKDGSDKVSTWADQSGNGNNLVQAVGANQPTWTAAALGGQSALRFYNTSTMVGADLSALTEGCVFCVMELDADPPATGNVVWTMGGQASNVPYSDGVVYESFGRTAQAAAGNLAPSFADPRVYDVQSKSAGYQVNVDGTNRYFTATSTPQFLASNTLGHATASPRGHIAEVIVYNSFLGVGTATYKRVTAYLGARYGITVA